MCSAIALINQIVWIFIYVLIASAVLSWLLAFNVVNSRNQVVQTLWNVFNQITEPVLRPLRRRLPNLGGIDLSPLIVVLALLFLSDIMIRQTGCSGEFFR